MADDKVITTSESSPVASAAADGHKRKHEDLELNIAPEQVTESEANSDRDSLDNGPQEEGNGGVDESETKRPRLEINGDNLGEADGLVSQNGYQEEMKEDQPEEETEVPESEDNNGQSAEGQESFEEPVQTINEEKDPNDNDIEKTDNEKTDGKTDNEKTDGKTDNEKTDDGNADELSEPNAEVEEPSELPREGDVPFHSSEGQAGSDSQILSRKMEVPNDKVGVLIGKGGDTIKSLQDNSGAKIQIERDADANPRSATRGCELVGTLQSIDKAEKLIKDVIAEADAGGSPSLVARGFSTVEAASGGEQLEIQVPHEKVGLIIGKGGETIRNLQTKSRAHIQLLQPNPSDGDQARERTVRVTGTKKQIEIAKEMIKDAIHQTIRPSPLSRENSQQGYRPRGHVTPHWGPRGPHHAQFSVHDYPQRGPYPQSSQYSHQSYSNYPPPQAPRSNYGPSWDPRTPAPAHGPQSQGNYSFGQHPGPDFGHPPHYSQAPSQPYGPTHGYNEAKYDHHAPSQHYGHMGSQPTPYGHSGYGPQDQYSKPPMYGMQNQVPPHSQPYSQPRPYQPGEVTYQGPSSAPQSNPQNMPPQQQSYPYASAPMQQSYPSYGGATDNYGHTPTASASAYPPQGGQPVTGYGQQGAQQAPGYPQTGPAGGYASYPTASQPGYTEQAAGNATYGYQGPTDPTYGTSQGAAAYAATGAVQTSYPQPSQTQPAYDQSGGYGNAPAVAGYGKSASPQPAAYPQYDSSQMYGAHR